MLEAALKEVILEETTMEASITMENSISMEASVTEGTTAEGTTTEEDTLVDGLLAEDALKEPPKREEPWILVATRKGGRPKPVPKPEDVKTIVFEPTIKAMTPLPLLSKEAIAGQHFYTCRDYKQTREYRVLKAIIKEFIEDTFKNSMTIEDPVRKAVCLGLGSFDPENGSWVTKEKAHVQLAAFLFIVEEIRKYPHLYVLDLILSLVTIALTQNATLREVLQQAHQVHLPGASFRGLRRRVHHLVGTRGC